MGTNGCKDMESRPTSDQPGVGCGPTPIFSRLGAHTSNVLGLWEKTSVTRLGAWPQASTSEEYAPSSIEVVFIDSRDDEIPRQRFERPPPAESDQMLARFF